MALEKVEPPKKDEPEPTPSENDDVSFIREPSKEKKTWADDIRETILIFGLPKKGKCLENQLIHTDDGSLYFSELKERGYVIGESLNEEIPTDFGYKQAKWFDSEVEKTHTTYLSNGIEISGTAEHRIRVFSDVDGIMWKRLDEIKPGDMVIQCLKELTRPTDSDITAEEAELLAHYVANGNRHRNSVVISTHKNRTIERIKEITKGKCTSCSEIKKDGRVVGITIYGKEMFNFFGDCGSTAIDKKIPLSVRKASRPIVCRFLWTYLECDGYLTNEQRIEFVTKSKQLSYEVRELLHSLGIYTYKTKKLVDDKEYDRISINVDGVKKLSDTTGLMYDDKKIEFDRELKSSYNRNYYPLRKYIRNQLKGMGWKNGYLNGERITPRYSITLGHDSHESRKTLKTRLSHIGGIKEIDDVLEYFYENDVYLTEVVRKNSKKDKTKVYDFTVPTTHSFLCNTLVNHNTWAYCSVIDYILNKKGNVYIISTDAGFPRTAKAYFGEKLPSVIDRIDVKTVFDINGIRSYYNEIKDKLKPEDLLVIDLVSDCWEWAQVDFVEQMSSGDIEEFVVNAMRDIKKFGLFDDNKWNYIKALHKFVEDIIIRKPCNFIGVANEKAVDVEVIKGGNKVKEMLVDLGFGDLGVRAGGFKLLPYKFETVVRVGYDEKSHFLQVIGDRGFGRDLKQRSYGRNMYGKLLEWRRSRNMWTK